MRPARAAIEPGVDSRTLEGILEKPEIIAGRSEKDRHFVEPHACARFVENPARDLDALPPLAGSRKEPHVSLPDPLGWLRCREEVTAQRCQVRFPFRLQHLHAMSELFHEFERRDIAE